MADHIKLLSVEKERLIKALAPLAELTLVHKLSAVDENEIVVRGVDERSTIRGRHCREAFKLISLLRSA